LGAGAERESFAGIKSTNPLLDSAVSKRFAYFSMGERERERKKEREREKSGKSIVLASRNRSRGTLRDALVLTP
jgi:hypothetical protein